jgi:hypothetical protein
MLSAAGVAVSTILDQRIGPGASPRAALHYIRVVVVLHAIARTLIEREHYLHSWPGGTMFCFGVMVGCRLLGALTIGVGPKNAHRLIDGVGPHQAVTLTRLWLSDDLPANAESRVIGIVLRSLRKHTSLKFVVSYADPSQGHVGTIYQATGWLYTGLSQPMPLYDFGDGVLRHSRSIAHAFGTHSFDHFKRNGVTPQAVPQPAKHRYVYLLDQSLRGRLTTPVLPYPKRQEH